MQARQQTLDEAMQLQQSFEAFQNYEPLVADDPKGVTARYLLVNLPQGLCEQDIVDYFGSFGMIEDMTLRSLQSGKIVGSVKFTAPTMELRHKMLKEQHVIKGSPIAVQTYKMQKLKKFMYFENQIGGKKTLAPEMHLQSGTRPVLGKGFARPHACFPKPAAPPKLVPAVKSPFGTGAWAAAAMAASSQAKAFAQPTPFPRQTPLSADPAVAMQELAARLPCNAGGKRNVDDDPVDLYELSDLNESITAVEIGQYFSTFDEIADVTLRVEGKTGKISGSVTFENPTLELQRHMLEETHVIKGTAISVQIRRAQADRFATAAESAASSAAVAAAAAAAVEGAQAQLQQQYEYAAQVAQMASLYAGQFGYEAYNGHEAYMGHEGFSGHQFATQQAFDQQVCSGHYHLSSSSGQAPVPRMVPPKRAGKGSADGEYISWSPATWTQVPVNGSVLPRQKGPSGSIIGPSGEEKTVTARFLLVDIPTHATEDDIRNHFGSYGCIEEVVLKHRQSGKITGSVKFADPTPEMRTAILQGHHELGGSPIQVQTWKMAKLQRPGYVAKAAAARYVPRSKPY